jgi:hypothetical protein
MYAYARALSISEQVTNGATTITKRLRESAKRPTFWKVAPRRLWVLRHT